MLYARVVSTIHRVLPTAIVFTTLASCPYSAQASNPLPLNDPNAIVQTVIVALESLQFPPSGRGTATMKTTHAPYRDYAGKELIVEFAFNGQKSRMDVFDSDNGVKHSKIRSEVMSDKLHIGISPPIEAGIVDPPDPFYREVGRDLHPAAFMKCHHHPLSFWMELFLGPKVNLSATVDATGILQIVAKEHIRTKRDGAELEYDHKLEFAFDTQNGLLPVRCKTGFTYPDRETYTIDTFRWKMYDSTPYVSSVIRDYKGESETSRTEFVITSFKPNVQISDDEFTLESLGVPVGMLIRDLIAGVNYRYGTVLTTEELEKPLVDANFVQRIREQDNTQGPNLLDVNIPQDTVDPNRVLLTDNADQDDGSTLSHSTICVYVLIVVGIIALLVYVFRYRQGQE